jgi:hypothetical protein
VSSHPGQQCQAGSDDDRDRDLEEDVGVHDYRLGFFLELRFPAGSGVVVTSGACAEGVARAVLREGSSSQTTVASAAAVNSRTTIVSVSKMAS